MSMKKILRILIVLTLFICSPSALADDTYSVAPTFSPYSAGVVKSEVLNEALKELNFIRKLAGVPNNVTLNADYTNKAQHGAVLLDANNVLTHQPSKPSDMSQSFYDLGYEATTHGNIFSGRTYSLRYSVKSYMDDNDRSNMTTVGHRRWLLNPRLKQTGFGISTQRGYSVTYVIEEAPEDYDEYTQWIQTWPINGDYIPWPVKGEHPINYFGANVPWSVTLRTSAFKDYADSDIVVKLTRSSDGQTWTFRTTQSDGYFNISHTTYGRDECIIFRPDNVSEYRNGERWQVEITGLIKQDTNESATISYTTTFGPAVNDYDDEEHVEIIKTETGLGGCNSGLNVFALLVCTALLHKKKV